FADIYITRDWISEPKLTKTGNQIVYHRKDGIKLLNLTQPDYEKDDHWDTILNKPKTNPKTPSTGWDITAENFHLREKNIAPESGYAYPLFSTADSLLYYISYEGESTRVVKKIKLDGTQKEEIFTINGRVSDLFPFEEQMVLYYTTGEKIYCLNLKNRQAKQIIFKHDYIYNTTTLNADIFDQIWCRFGQYFYDPNMHNQDWKALHTKFAPYTQNIRSVNQLQKIVDELIGRVNASHTGFTPRTEEKAFSLERAYAGAIFDYQNRLPVGIQIKKIYHNSDLFQKHNIQPNDIVLAINHTPVYDDTEIAPLFTNLIGKDIILKIQKKTEVVEVKITGISWETQNQLRYDDWVLNNYRTVQTQTDKRIGYLHIQRMNQRSLRKFEQDFLAVNSDTDALIIDVRGNGGGNISNQLIDFITRQQTAYSYGRPWGIDLVASPSTSYNKPIVCLIDQDSYSDAEVFSAAFQDLNLGDIIGMPTSGSVIGTGEESFMDGSSIRMPRHAWFRLNKENQELNGVKPNIIVDITPDDMIHGNDPQLQKAINILQEKLN
ncbi:MAG: S41 family peptidase, partial [Candidatus Cloacimonetes bacterium]|nr:S41 family peptidase [Candidatus Cloacimonadota bacterium]